MKIDIDHDLTQRMRENYLSTILSVLSPPEHYKAANTGFNKCQNVSKPLMEERALILMVKLSPPAETKRQLHQKRVTVTI